MSKLSLPNLLSYTRSLQPSLGEFYFLRDNKEYPITVKEITIRGSISDYKSGTGEALKNIDTPNIQRIDVAHLPNDIDTYYVRFSLTVLPHSLKPNACNNPEFQKELENFSKSYAEKNGYQFLAERYLENIINGRWLWRNQYAHNIQITIEYKGEKNIFKKSSRQELTGSNLAFFQNLAKEMANALAGKIDHINIKVTASGVIGNGQEIFPSQEFIENRSSPKKQGDKSKELAKFKLDNDINVAVLHSQKIGNALRTIDIWYSSDAINYPLAVEPYGIDQTIQDAKRKPIDKKHLYYYLDNLDETITKLNNSKDAESMDGDLHFVAACLIRGGVYSGEKKEKPKKETKA